MFHLEAVMADRTFIDGTFDTQREAEKTAHEIRLFNKHRHPDLLRLNVLNESNDLVYSLVVNGEGSDFKGR